MNLNKEIFKYEDGYIKFINYEKITDDNMDKCCTKLRPEHFPDLIKRYEGLTQDEQYEYFLLGLKWRQSKLTDVENEYRLMLRNKIIDNEPVDKDAKAKFTEALHKMLKERNIENNETQILTRKVRKVKSESSETTSETDVKAESVALASEIKQPEPKVQVVNETNSENNSDNLLVGNTNDIKINSENEM